MISPILDIYKEIEIFLESNHYSIPAIMIVLVPSNNASLTIDPLCNSLNVLAQLVVKEDLTIVATLVLAAIAIYKEFYLLLKRNI